jgi:nicotinate-nucleotide pyrophosphorylase (carboxylating)
MRIEQPEEQSLDFFIEHALAEDVGAGDVTTMATIPEHATGRAYLQVKGQGILAGVAIARRVFSKVDSTIEFSEHLGDGAAVQAGDIAFELSGRIHTLLTCERLVLNIMQRMSGIATLTHAAIQRLQGTACGVLDTRKTAPMMRLLEKQAVQIGGGTNHRMGLFDMILIKDNHIDWAGGIAQALAAAAAYRAQQNPSLSIEIETRNLAEVQQVLEVGGADRILLDNMPLGTMREAVELVGQRAQTEASGNLTIDNIRAVAECGVDYVSMGSLTHSYQSLDMSLKVR